MRNDHVHPSDGQLVLLGDEQAPTGSSRPSRHVAGCRRCQQRIRQLAAAASELEAWYRETAAPVPDQDDRARRGLSAQLQRLATAHARPWRGRLRDAVLPGAIWAPPLAAVLVLAIWTVGRLALTSSALDNSGADPRALPVASLTPGAIRDVRLDAICSGTHVASSVPADMQQTVLRAYAMVDVPVGQYELDYLITPELGGATDPRNLWPQRYSDRRWNARVKDELEALLPSLVCSHQVDLAAAQRDLAVDWIAAYKKYFRTSRPRHVYSVRDQVDEDEQWPRLPTTPSLPVFTLASVRLSTAHAGR